MWLRTNTVCYILLGCNSIAGVITEQTTRKRKKNYTDRLEFKIQRWTSKCKKLTKCHWKMAKIYRKGTSLHPSAKKELTKFLSYPWKTTICPKRNFVQNRSQRLWTILGSFCNLTPIHDTVSLRCFVVISEIYDVTESYSSNRIRTLRQPSRRPGPH